MALQGDQEKYKKFFRDATGLPNDPYPYQIRLATEDSFPELLNVPTGLGKTAAVILAWLWRRRFDERFKNETPRRLVYCLPMRVLVEQTASNVCMWLKKIGIAGKPGDGKISVHVFMGGSEDVRKATWAEYPEEDAILIGTQDMLLSRALMRGYGMRSRYQWPIHFALLHNDVLWVFDEVQLMGPGLATSAQLEAFRTMRDLPLAKPSKTLWISATLNKDWLATVDLAAHISESKPFRLMEVDQKYPAIRCRRESVKRLSKASKALTEESKVEAYANKLAAEISQHHQPGTQTLVIVNTVERAQTVYQAVRATKNLPEPLLVHSRFRPAERRIINDKLRTYPRDGRIIIATQAIEAGIDITSRTLFTELAPWSSLVQRFGRCNREGEWNEKGGADVYWIDVSESSPYEQQTLDEARSKLAALVSASPKDLPPTDQSAPLFPVIRKRDFLDLFNTERDLTGFDVDVSPYIRDADDTDVFLFWRAIENGNPAGQPRPTPEEICRAGIGKAKDFLKKHKSNCYFWDGIDRKWQKLDRDVYPGMTVMVDASVGGYDFDLGFLPTAKSKKDIVIAPVVELSEPDSIDDDPDSLLQYAVELAEHLGHVENEVAALCDAVGERVHKEPATRAGRWHDVGKAHRAFKTMLLLHDPDAADKENKLWAKGSVRREDKKKRNIYAVCGGERGYTERKHFRHEFVSMLAWLEQHGQEPDADLIAYLILAHHGKVRMLLRSLPNETEPTDANTTLFARGVWQGDELPGFAILNRETVNSTILRLDLMRLGRGPMGDSWTARTQRLLKNHGPFRLAWLETLVRLADWRASRKEQIEAQKKEADNAKHELETINTTVADTAARREGPAPLGTDSSERGRKHGLRGRAGGAESASSGTRPSHATRHIETTLGVLTYTELAPHLGRKVRLLEEDFESGRFDDCGLDDDLIRELHSAICGDLVPQMAGFRRTDVTVGAHTPPPWSQVPVLMRDYTRDLQTRLSVSTRADDERLLETLAFAEGRLLFIHPFTDFNGRVTRLFLRLILRRLDLSPARLAPAVEGLQEYLNALRAADHGNWQPLMDIWRMRIEESAP